MTQANSLANLGNSPAFSAYANADQSLSGTTYTKVVLNNKVFDTNSNFDSATNYRFTPTVAGYYQFNAGICFSPTVVYGALLFYKNGSAYKLIGYTQGATGYYTGIEGSELIYLNGSTDYVELYAFLSNSGSLIASVLTNSIRMSASLTRGN